MTGVIISGTTKKGRLTIENKKVETLLNYETGLDKYYGLLDLAEKFEILTRSAGKYNFPDGTEVKEKLILNNPEKYFTKEILDLIDKACMAEFRYGNGGKTSEDVDEDEEAA